ncbi:MAG: carotenoid biosynthesis protein [Candidatus Nanopelagicales bacterium]
MSVRVYTGPHAARRRGRHASSLRAVPIVMALLTIALQIAWPLTSGAARDVLTALTVVVFFLASATHALVVRGAPWAAGWLLASAGIGLAAEVIGTRTGALFGNYAYSGKLGPELLGVPLVIPLAWAMMSYPCLLAARRLVRSPLATALVAAIALASWDLFLDPQMVTQGAWAWTAATYQHLIGIPGVPWQNFAGWLCVSFVLMLVLDRLPRRNHDGAVPPDGTPALLLTWTYASSVLLNVGFEHRPGVAAWGGVVMGLVVVPYLVRVWVDRP